MRYIFAHHYGSIGLNTEQFFEGSLANGEIFSQHNNKSEDILHP